MFLKRTLRKRVQGEKPNPVENRMQQCCWGNIVRDCQQILLSIVTNRIDLDTIMLFNIVDNQEQCCHNNIVASRFQQPVTTV